MSPGIVVSAADVIEDTTAIKNLNIPAGEMDMILFATECDPMVKTKSEVSLTKLCFRRLQDTAYFV